MRARAPGRALAVLGAALVLVAPACADTVEERRARAQREAAPAKAPEPPPQAAPARPAPPPVVKEKTRVEVVEDLGRGGAFSPRSLYRRLSPGVVTVISRFGDAPLAGEGDAGLGSGFVLDGEGYVATNAHVVTTGRAPRLSRAREVFVEFPDANRVPARIVGDDPNSDVALLKLDPRGLDLTTLRLGRSDGVSVGEPVVAIGSPFGEQSSLSVGVVSADDRDIESLTGFAIGGAVQTDAAINRGNSGGPLLDRDGEVIGINSQIKSTSGGGEGVGFAVPVDTARRSLDQLRTSGRVAYGFMGVSSQPLYPQLARRLGVDAERGVLVASVEPGSPAAKAGIVAGREKIEFQGQRDVPRGGDVILSVDGEELREANDLSNEIALKSPGQRVRLEVLRGRDRREVQVELGARPPSAPRR